MLNGQGLVDICLVCLFFTLGLVAKEMLVTLPFVLLLMYYWPLGRFQIGYGEAQRWKSMNLSHPSVALCQFGP